MKSIEDPIDLIYTIEIPNGYVLDIADTEAEYMLNYEKSLGVNYGYVVVQSEIEEVRTVNNTLLKANVVRSYLLSAVTFSTEIKDFIKKSDINKVPLPVDKDISFSNQQFIDLDKILVKTYITENINSIQFN